MEDVRFPRQHLSYETLPQNISKVRTVLQHLKQNLKHFYSGNVSVDSHAYHFRFSLKVLQYLIIDFHALHYF